MAAIITQSFASVIAKRAFGVESLTLSECQIGLGRADIAGIHETSPLYVVSELQAAENPGYARAYGTWSVVDSTDGPVARFTIREMGFQNAGILAWQTVGCLFLTGLVNLLPRLLWAEGVEPFALEPGASVRLANSRIEIPWKSRAE